MFKKRSRSIAFLVSLGLVLLLALPLAAKEKLKLKLEPWQIDGIVAALGDEPSQKNHSWLGMCR
jgi:hypothetical protein